MAATDRQRDRAMALPKLGHLAALDGIRGLAVAIVVLHHLKVPGIHAGWLGVDLFFALSGFLITESVLGTGNGTGLGAFWKRRAWRLGPAMAVLLAWYAVISLGAADRDMRMSWLLASAGQYLDIHDAASLHGPFSPHLGHLWSLSMEVQFYIVWPVLLTVLLRRGVARPWIVAAPALLFVLSTVERTVLAINDMSWNRLYLAPDTRSTALWAGCVVGLLHAWGAFDRSPLLRPAAVALAIPAVIALGWLVILPSMSFVLRAPFLWGFTIIGTCAGLLVAAGASARGGPLRWFLESPPLEWLGRISYSVYLWHVPLIAELVRARPEMSTAAKVAIIVPASLLVGWLSYVVVERPLLSARGRARLWARLRRSPAPVG
jgi:peptidoglycan/LPS O-acetylase OafA/YrhL